MCGDISSVFVAVIHQSQYAQFGKVIIYPILKTRKKGTFLLSSYRTHQPPPPPPSPNTTPAHQIKWHSQLNILPLFVIYIIFYQILYLM